MEQSFGRDADGDHLRFMREGKGAVEVCGQRDNQAREIQKVPSGEAEAVGKHEHAQS